MEQVTESIARFVCTTTYRAVPPEAVEAARMHILDTLGVLIAGSQEGVAPIVKNHVSAAGGPPESTLMTQGVRTSAQYAAFGNGIIGHVLDYDDYEWPSFAHPSVTVLPAAIALAEKLRRGGQECLTAYLLGMDVIAKIGKGMSPDHYDKGWHSTGTLGSLGAACACASLLGLDSEKTKIALGIAASMSSGLRGNFGTMTKSLHAGHAARNGVEAALLAWAGFTASARILEGDLGFCDLFSDTGKYRPEEMTKDLGNPFSLVFPRVGKKLYPSCAATHAFLDGMFRLIEEHDIKPEEVRSVGLRVVDAVAEARKADFVVVGGHNDFNYWEMMLASFALQNGAHFYTTNRDATFPTPEGIVPATGAVLASIEVASGRTAVSIGKPEPEMIDVARSIVGPGRMIMVGDRLDSDIAGGRRAGIATALVLTGVTTREEALASRWRPDYVLKDVGGILYSDE